MLQLEPLIEYSPIFGMNTVNDLKDLAPGECTELVNARPGNPPTIRNGCDVFIVSGSENYTLVPPAIAHTSEEGTEHVVFWVLSGTDYKLVKVNAESPRPVLTVIGTATGLSDPHFSFLKAHGELYCFCDEEMATWDGLTNDLSHKIITIGDNYSVSRPMNITEEPAIASVTVDTSGIAYGSDQNGKFVCYAASYIRRDDSAAFNSSGYPTVVTTAVPGSLEGPSSTGTFYVKQVTSTSESFILSVLDESESRAEAIAQGATHVRIWKSFAQATSQEAQDASKYFVVDLPASGLSLRSQITAVNTAEQDVSVDTSTAHNLTTGDSVAFINVGGSTELNTGSFTATVSDSNTITLDNTDTSNFSAFTTGGYVGKTKAITNIVGPAGTAYQIYTYGVSGGGYSGSGGYQSYTPTSGPIIVTAAAHGLVTGDTVILKGSGGPFTAVAARSETNAAQTANYSAALGLNGVLFTITVQDADTFTLNGADKKDYMSYSGGGEALVKPATVSAVTEVNNDVVVTAPSHNLTTQPYVKIEDTVGSVELNDRQFEYEVVDADNIRLTGITKSSVTDYVSGGSIRAMVGGAAWEDTVTEGALEGELYQYSASNYSSAPLARFAEYLKNRMWLFGIPGQSQKAYFSEVIGGDSGTPIDDAIAFPQKYSSRYKADYVVTCASDVNVNETGLESLADDLYFFFEERIYALFGGDPTLTSPILISPDIGCPFPTTIVKANIPYFGGLCLLFLSNRGPAVVEAGGKVKLVTEFTVKELWPETGDVFEDLRTNDITKTWIQRNCSGMFWNDTWTIGYKNYSGTHKVFEYYFNPIMAKDAKAPRGAYEIELGQI
jgi:hypothetical protein